MAHKAYIAGFQPEIYYPSDPQAYKDVQDEDLGKIVSFITKKRPAGVEQGYNHLQNELAHKQGLPILQWFTPDEKEDTKMSLPGIKITNCRRGHGEAGALEFLTPLQEAAYE